MSFWAKEAILSMGWRYAMQILALIVFISMIIASVISKNEPESYGFNLFKKIYSSEKQIFWPTLEAFKKWSAVGVTFAFLTSMMGEFIIWSQAVNYWMDGSGLSLNKATNLFIMIGLFGLVAMPLMGKVQDILVSISVNEPRGRKLALIIAPCVGVCACILMILTSALIIAGYIATLAFAIYWATEPGSAAGYIGTVFGKRNMGHLWGFATLWSMGIGPFMGSYLGGQIYTWSRVYNYTILFALFCFSISALLALSLPEDYLAINGVNNN